MSSTTVYKVNQGDKRVEVKITVDDPDSNDFSVVQREEPVLINGKKELVSHFYRKGILGWEYLAMDGSWERAIAIPHEVSHARVHHTPGIKAGR